MEIFVNSSKLEFSLQDETRLGPVFSGLNDWVEQGNKKIWSLQVDGTPYQVAKPESFSDMEISSISRIDVTVGEKDAAKEMAKRVDLFKESIKNAINLIDGIVDAAHQGQDDVVKENWLKILAAVNEFNQVIPIFADINSSTDKVHIGNDYGKLKDILAEVFKTQELNDNVAFCDQLLYELKPQLEKWQQFLTTTRSSIKKG